MKTEILKEADPAKIKRLGRIVQIDATEWERVSFDIMKSGIWAKNINHVIQQFQHCNQLQVQFKLTHFISTSYIAFPNASDCMDHHVLFECYHTLTEVVSNNQYPEPSAIKKVESTINTQGQLNPQPTVRLPTTSPPTSSSGILHGLEHQNNHQPIRNSFNHTSPLMTTQFIANHSQNNFLAANRMSAGPIVEIEKPDDIINLARITECRISTDLRWRALGSTRTDTNFAWYLAKEFFSPEDMIGKTFEEHVENWVCHQEEDVPLNMQ
ncbi:unnamed protein product [Mytilus edulis]|uniref:Uncharacterized protein n=1 Tax=Mytilus edulis TaxID=6550 RepID=A0A8S3UFY5_MYTED|nr:unnamed protein product [Mytilus edulis]